MYKTSELFDLTKSAAGGYLAKFEYPWQEGMNRLFVYQS
mgnify:CR=1 FL=1